MILYRVMSSYELKKLMDADVNENEKPTLRGTNTFKYEKDVEYMHFFRYASHAKNMISMFGEIVVKCDIPDELIDKEGLGFYSFLRVSTIPECIIKKENFDVNFIKGFKYDLTMGWCTPNIPIGEHKGRYIGSYNELYEELFKDLEKEFYMKRPPVSLNDYVASKLKNVDLDKLLLSYIDRVHEKHYPSKPSKSSKFSLFKRR